MKSTNRQKVTRRILLYQRLVQRQLRRKGSGTHVRGSAGTWAQRIVFVFLRPGLMGFYLTR